MAQNRPLWRLLVARNDDDDDDMVLSSEASSLQVCEQLAQGGYVVDTVAR